MIRALTCVSLVLATWLGLPTPLQAAESYDNCTGFITTLPATVSAQGTWCLNKDVTTSMTTGSAITIATNNVTIDCNHFKIGGLGAGTATTAYGVYAGSRLNAVVRNCNIRGFLSGVYLFGSGGGGHVVEDSRFDSNTYVGIYVEGDGSVVRRNLVNDTGGSTAVTGSAHGIRTFGDIDVLDNTVSGVLPTINSALGGGHAFGIFTGSNGSGRINGNGIRGLVPAGPTGQVQGIYNDNNGRIHLRDNDLTGVQAGYGLYCSSAEGHARDNTSLGFSAGIGGCTNSGGNVP